ncbi:M23 family metallopeptidase, partial [Candidatus Peregrinibacteria bacterium]|nr:M23 family metallopeptidase [Candidatus Peregrinibacteria bacterium]
MNSVRSYLEKNYKQILSIVGAFVLVGMLFGTSVMDFQANVLAGKKSAPFDGTVTPVKRVPNWVDLAAADWKLPYAQIPQDKLVEFPTYDPSVLTIPASSLNYKNAADKAIRNAQVTFSTPYMGDYKLDGKEYAGSHLAVDIKMPAGTPVYAIANGVVVKAQNQASGFGYHVVLRHDDVPSLNDPNQKTTYYSG